MLVNMSLGTQILRDVDGRKIGEIERSRGNLQILRDRDGRRLGEYDESRNLTRDQDGRRIGEGNLLVVLLNFPRQP